jgi:hypothetical protein
MNKQFFIPILLMIFSLRYISLLEECFDYTVEIEIESTTSNGYMFVNSMFYAALLQCCNIFDMPACVDTCPHSPRVHANRVLFIDYYVGKSSTNTYVRT